jgi:RHS repeat-associated protein
MNGNQSLDLGGPDRVSENDTSYTTFNGKDVRQVVSLVYPTNDTSTLTVATSISAVAGDESWSISFGRTNHQQTTRDRANAARIETVTGGDGTQTISVYTNGLPHSVVRKDSTGGTTSVSSISYDPFLRLSSSAEPAANGDTRTTAYVYNSANAATNVTVSAGDLSQTTSYVLDSMGRRTQTIMPDGGVVTNSYSLRGELMSQSGARTYPVTYTYTGESRLNTMSTYRNGIGGSADVTTWNYDANRGFMASKEYADSSMVYYQYLANGALYARIWARGIETIYSYDNGGSLTNVSYSDSTPPVIYALDRLGRIVTVTDATGTRTNVYADDGSLLTESIPGGAVSPGTVTRTYDAIGRETNFSLSIGGSQSFATAYSRDNAGRISTVSDGTRTGTYTYGLDSTTWTNLSFGSALNTSRTFDGLNRLATIVNISPSGTVYSATYSLNQANQRTTNSLADGGKWVYTYDSLGQVVSGKKYFSDGTPVQGAQFEYSFDAIGNRSSAKAGTESSPSASYTANNLNQYFQRDVPGVLDVTGEAINDSTVSVRLETAPAITADRYNEYFWKELSADNSSAIFSTTNLGVTAYMTQVQGTNTNSLVRTETKMAILPQTPEQFAYDLDGNLLSDGLWTNTWNGENRLISMESKTGIPACLRKRLDFKYDFQGRRTQKIVSEWSGSSYAPIQTNTFIWDGWNIIAETCNKQSVVTTNFYTWGQDLSGTLQGAGGVGGLLIASINGTNCFPVYNGNGDVMGLVKSDDGSLLGEIECSPFGERVKATDLCSTFTFGFSTKPVDHETGKVAFQLRDYDPETGRWMSRDRIDDEVLLYGFVGNCPTAYYDILGLAAAPKSAEPCCICVTEPQNCSIGVTWGAKIEDVGIKYASYQGENGQVTTPILWKMLFGTEATVTLKHSKGASLDLCHLKQDVEGHASYVTDKFGKDFAFTDFSSSSPVTDYYHKTSLWDSAHILGRFNPLPTVPQTVWFQAHVIVEEAPSVETWWGYAGTGSWDANGNTSKGYVRWHGAQRSPFSARIGVDGSD